MSRARAVCLRCRRPEPVCWCAHLVPLPTRTRVLILQHPRERRVPVGTARMAHLALPSSVLRVGVDFAADPVAMAALSTASYVVFPHPRATDVRELDPEQVKTLVVIDGTWAQARKLLRLNPAVAALPWVTFTRDRPSEYRIRREPAAFCVSTIEALAEILDVLEPERGPFARLLDPFRHMVARQIAFQEGVRAFRHHKPLGPPRPQPRATLATRLGVDRSRLVCVQGEANAWPMRDPARQPPETVCWAAWRPSTGERYQAVVAPRRPLAPSTPHHLELSAERLRGGLSLAAWREDWARFTRGDDVLVEWGSFAGDLTLGVELPRPARTIDLRSEVRQLLGRRIGTIEDCAAALGAAAPPLGLAGRAGRRLEALAGVFGALWPAPLDSLQERR